MKTSKLAMVVLALVACSAMIASAAIDTNWVGIGTKTISGTDYKVWRMEATTGSDWTNSRLDVSLTSGAMYNDAVGGPSVPNPAFLGTFPDLEWDTYATIPVGYDPAVSVGFAGSTVMNATTVGASWFDTHADGPGTWTLFQLTLSTDANGTITGRNYDVDTQGVGVPFEFVISGGRVYVPEPVTLSILAVGAVGMLLRRRR